MSKSQHNMTTLMKRLEAATSRLEDLASFFGDMHPEVEGDDGGSTSVPSVKVSVDEGISAPVQDIAPKFSQYKELSSLLAELTTSSAEIDAALGAQAELFQEAHEEVLHILEISQIAQKPSETSAEYAQVLAPLSQVMQRIVTLKSENRSQKMNNHFSTLAEGAPALGWLTSPVPGDYVQDFVDSAQFYANRVLKDHKEHGAWIKGFLGFLKSLKEAVSSEFPEGLQWSPTGVPLTEALVKSSVRDQGTPKPSQGATGIGAGGPPPPPPPPPPSVEQLIGGPAGSASSDAGGMNAVFSDLNKGTDIVSGLKHVDRKALKQQGKQKPVPPPKPASLRKSTNESAPQPVQGKMYLQDSRWIVENYSDAHELVIEPELSQTILIDNCKQCTIQIKGKATAVSLTGCKKVGVVVDSLVAGMEIIKSEGVGLQVLGTLLSITIDQTHNSQLYLGNDALSADIYTSQTSAINLNVPTEVEGDYTEFSLAEQIKHNVRDGKLVDAAISSGM